MKKFLFVIAFTVGLTFNVHASTVGTMKIITGNHGGVVTVQKQVSNPADVDGRSTRGRVTLSDVRLNIIRVNDGTDEDDTILDSELPLVDDDEASTTDRPELARVSGRVRFHGEQDNISKQLTLNGQFKSLLPQRNTLVLQDITAEVINDELELTGTILINDREIEINSAPDVTKAFVRRLFWLIRKS